MARINFFSESIDFKILHPQKTTRWIRHIIQTEGFSPGEINIIFCSDDYLRGINVEYLAHDTYTDIITFDNADDTGSVDGDIFISIDRVKENALHLASAFEDELHRVIIHGILHLLGYNDKDPEEQTKMRRKEDACLSLRNVPRGTNR